MVWPFRKRKAKKIIDDLVNELDPDMFQCFECKKYRHTNDFSILNRFVGPEDRSDVCWRCIKSHTKSLKGYPYNIELIGMRLKVLKVARKLGCFKNK